MDDLLVQKITEQIDIVALVSEFVKLEKKGKNFMGLCPFHAEKSPSFSVSPEKKIAKCMGCGEGGNPITFYRKIKNISYEQAILELAERLGIKVTKNKLKQDPNLHLYKLVNDAAAFYSYNLKNSESGREAIEYLYSRKMDDSLIEQFKLGLAPTKRDSLYQMLQGKGHQVSDMINLGLVKQDDLGEYYDLFQGRLMFPITDTYGRIVGFSGRTLDKGEVVKYINSPETKIFKKGELLYRYHEATRSINQNKKVILHEGFFDVIASHKAGIDYTIATMGTALTEKQAQLIKAISNHVIIMYDGDKAGLNSMVKAYPILSKQKLKIDFVKIPDKLDPDDYYNKFGSQKYLELLSNSVDYYQFSYSYYREGKDFSNSNDVTEFKRQFQGALKFADPIIKDHYQQLVKDELGIALKFGRALIPEIENIPDYNFPFPEKKVKQRFSGYEKAELALIAWLVRMPELKSITEEFDIMSVSPVHNEIIIQLIDYYENGAEKFYLEGFLVKIPQYSDYFIEHVMSQDELCDLGLKWSENVKQDILKVLTQTSVDNRIKDLKKMILTEQDPVKKLSYIKEFQQLQGKLKKRSVLNNEL